MIEATIVREQGQLAIREECWSPFTDRPAEYRYYWPPGIPVREDDSRIGLTGYFIDNYFREHGVGYGVYTVSLPDGGQTKCLRIEERPVKPPRRGKGYAWEWDFGRWRKRCA